VFRDLRGESAAPAADFDSLRTHRVAFIILNVFLLGALLFLHLVFASFWGQPSDALFALLGACLAVRTVELMLVRGRTLSPKTSAVLTWGSVAFNLALAVVLASIIDREDSQYAALLMVPILECAFRFGLAATLSVVAAADAITFYWVWRYFDLHPPVHSGEYFEAGTTCIIFLIAGLLVSTMARHLKRARERLLQEEKLATIGRVSSVVAHEIRNPVAMISSSLATAKKLTGPGREEMLGIAAKESERLVGLTSSLLAYGRPRRPAPARRNLRDTVQYVAEACRARAQEKSVSLRVEAPEEAFAEYDPGLVEQTLMNLVLNAVEASPAGTGVDLLVRMGGGEARIDVENSGGPISPEAVPRLFEPFFTTKPAGTGLGLATAHSAARAHGGRLVLAGNSDRVRFSLFLPRQWKA
jgi:signal transduction histidine kinase